MTHHSRLRRGVLLAAAVTAVPLIGTAVPAVARDHSPELSVTTRLADRRFVETGDRFYEVGATDATYPATGWHIRGEMGGFWTQPIKLLDGVWFGLNGSWLKANRFTSGEGYSRMDYGGGVTRTDVVPDGGRAGLVGLTFHGPARHVTLTVDAHSELMSSYPWGWTTPSQATANLPDTGSYDSGHLVFRDTGNGHDWAAVVGSQLTPSAHDLGPNFRGPQDPALVCPAPTDNEPPLPYRCDDGPYGRGTGGQLAYTLDIPAGGRTVWFAVAGSDQGLPAAYGELGRALHDPAGALARKQATRAAVADRTRVDLPGDPLLAQSVEWSKQNLADAVQESRDLRLFASEEGSKDGPVVGTLAKARWIGAGWPDYPWIFGTDGEYTAYAAVAAGDFTAIEGHLRTLQQISDVINTRSGKVVHEVTPGGQVYYGANDEPGDIDETAKFPSAVALVWRWTGDTRFRDDMYDFTVRNLRYLTGLDTDGDGWPEGSGNVERPGMGAEKLDVAVYLIRGLYDLADMAASKGDTATATWANAQAAQREQKFEQAWWYGGDAQGYADSLADPGNQKVFQRHWTGLTPLEAELTRPGHPTNPLASPDHALATLTQRERDCYTGEFGLFHTGTGPTSDPAGNKGASCDSVVSSVNSDREVFTLGNSVMAVAEGDYGRLTQQQRYTTANARVQLDPSVWEMPGAMPEIAPSPDFGANIDKDFASRSSLLQAWGTYGILWPVVSQQLGVSPDLGNGRLSVVPQLPSGQNRIAGSDIRVGSGSVDVTATRSGDTLRTTVDTGVRCRLTVGAVLPAGALVAAVSLDGHGADYRLVRTARGTEVQVSTTSGHHVLTLRVR